MDLGKAGGEDTAYFSEFRSAGGRLAYAPQALITEEVPPNRASLSWLLKRRFRFGQTHGMLLLTSGATDLAARIKNILAASAKSIFCFGMALINIFRAQRMIFWLLRGTLHMGVISRLFGKREFEYYG